MIGEKSCIKCEWFKAAAKVHSHSQLPHPIDSIDINFTARKCFTRSRFAAIHFPLHRPMIYVIILLFIIYIHWTFTFNNDCSVAFRKNIFVFRLRIVKPRKHTKLSKMHREWKFMLVLTTSSAKNIFGTKFYSIFFHQFIKYLFCTARTQSP